MAKGRKSKPTEQKKLQGNPGGRKLPVDEPKPKTGIPDMPEWLELYPRAMQNWCDESAILNGMKVMTVADAGSLAMRCYIFSEMVQLAYDVKDEGRTLIESVVNKKGEIVDGSEKVKHNPKVKQLESLIKEYRTYGSLLGLDPSSRTKLHVQPNDGPDELEAFMGNGGIRAVK